MTISRWKIMACTLGLSVGGLAIVAGPMNNRLNAQWETRPTPAVTLPAPAQSTSDRPATVPVSQETLPPLTQTLEIVAPTAVPELPSAPVITLEPIPQPSVQLFGPEALPMPRQVSAPFEVDVETVTTTPAPAYPPSQPVAPPLAVESVPMTLLAPPTVPVIQPEPLPPVTTLLTPPPPVQPVPPAVRIPAIRQVSTSAAKLKMLVRLGDGKPRFEIRTSDGTEMLFKVYGEKVEMNSTETKNSAFAGVTALGKVRFVGPGVEGTCDQLSVLSGTGEVLLKGNVYMKTKHGKSWSEVTAEKMLYHIGKDGLTTASGSESVRPASYNWRE